MKSSGHSVKKDFFQDLKMLSDSDAVSEVHAAVRFVGAVVGGGGAVAGNHLAGAPAHQAHEIDLAALGQEPLVGEGVAELVGM